MGNSEEEVIISRSKLDQLESDLANFKSGVKYSELRRKIHDLEKEKEFLTRQVFNALKAYNETSKELPLLKKEVIQRNENVTNIEKESSEDKGTITRLNSRIKEQESTFEEITRWVKENRWKYWKKFPYSF